MTSNAGAVEILRGIADLLDVLGEKFKPEAYRRAARTIESLTEDLAKVSQRNELETLPGVGAAIAEKLREYLSTGQVPYYERLKREVPPGIVELVRLPGLGPKTARRFWTELGVEGPGELADAIAQGRLGGKKGFGAKKNEQNATALDAARAAPAASSVRSTIEEIYPLAERIVAVLREVPGTAAVEVAGSFRRRRETVGDLDLLVTSSAAEKVFDTFSALPEVKQVRLRGGTKETVVLDHGLQVDLRVVEPAAFGAALQYFTGSKDHNVHLRTIARDRGLKINEYGVFRGEERIGGRTEPEVYATLGLPWIPPELREDRGEIESAEHGTLPRLVTPDDLTEELHLHLAPDAGAEEVRALWNAARLRHLSFVGVVIAGVGPDGRPFTLPEATVDRLRSTRPEGIGFGRGLEVGPGTLPAELRDVEADYRILRPTAAEALPAPSAPGGPTAWAVAHVGPPTGAGHDGVRAWIDRARAQRAGIEIGPGPERLDSTWGRVARESGTSLVIPTGIGEPGEGATGPIALGFARRAGAEAKDLKRGPPRTARRPRVST